MAKRIGVAREKALLEALKRSINLAGATLTGVTISSPTISSPTITSPTITSPTISGATLSDDIVISGGGAVGIAYSEALTVSAAIGDYDAEIELPKNAMILDCGFKVTTQIGGSSGGTEIKIDFGTTAGGEQIVALVTACNASSTMAAGAMMSVVAQNKGDASGAAFGGFKDAATLWAAAARSIYAQFEVADNVQDADGEVVAWVKYAVVDISS